MPAHTASGAPTLISPHTLHGRIAQEKPIGEEPNFVFSPLSIAYVSDMARIGANGRSQAELTSISSSSSSPISQKNTLLKNSLVSYHHEDGVVPSITLNMANRIYVDNEFLSDTNTGSKEIMSTKQVAFNEYKTQLQAPTNPDYGKDLVHAVCFKSDAKKVEKEVNAFVSEKTKGHIKEILPKGTLKSDTRLVLINALYFKAPWATKFNEETHKDVFYALGKNNQYTEKSVKMMQHVFSKNFGYYKSETVTAVLLPYLNNVDNGLLHMTFIMPKDIKVLEAELMKDPTIMDDIVNRLYGSMLSGGDIELDLSLPKFKISATSSPLDLKQILSPLGLTDIFEAGVADFSRLTGDQSLFVSSFLHQAHIEVNQDGTEASAATSMQISLMSFMPVTRVEKVKYDHPFLFQIRYSGFVPYGTPRAANEDLVLFSGRIGNPKE